MRAIHRAAIIAASLSFAFTTPVFAANEYPVDPGDYVEVSGISVDDGHDLEYLNYLAGTWRSNQDYAKAQGWITGYEILSNENKRPGEPDVYLVTRFKEFANTAEGTRRGEAMQAHMRMTQTQMQAASGDRAKYRHQLSSQLLRAWVWNK